MPHVSRAAISSSLHDCQTQSSMSVSLLTRPKSGRENDASPVLMSTSTEIFAKSFTCSRSMTMRLLIPVHSSLLGRKRCTKEVNSSASNTPASFANRFNSQSRKNEGKPSAERKLLFFKSL